MSVRKSERLLNLLIMLLVQRHYVPKSRIRSILYPDASDEAFDRMFDRDKDELRSLGVPIEVGQLDPLFDDEPGYRIRPDRFALPPVSLEPDEAAVVGLATRVWEHAKLAEATSEAVRKLTAQGLEVDLAALEIAQPRLSADEPVFDVFWEAVQARQAVVFDYRRTGETTTTRRHLQPWGVARHAGRWYVVGFDVDRGDERVFRLSRVVGDARTVGEPGAYEVPAGTDVRAVARRLAPPPERTRISLLVRPDAGHSLRTGADSIQTGVTGPDGADDWHRVVLTRSPFGMVDEVLAHGADVVVEEPAELQDRVVARLRAALAGFPPAEVTR
ncbi:YafY family protein [Nocardioides fonticola]|uniref:YafY family protein n=1 Tax=Nocardioides fonticola TaxID=450363 RepID=A0ABP7XUK1_9ACTN